MFHIFLLLLIPKYGIAMLTSADAPSIDDVAHEDTTIANLTRMGHFEKHLNGGIEYHVTTYNRNGYTLYHVRRILHATVYPFLTTLADAMHVVVLKPVDVR